MCSARGVDPSALVLEVTETEMMADPIRMVRMLERLAALGIEISVDAFGTGYSSLSYLQRLPVHEMKVDKSFVLDMTSSDANTKIVRSIVDLGHNLGLRVVAEGVEDRITWDALASLGCDIAQRYYLSPHSQARSSRRGFSHTRCSHGRQPRSLPMTARKSGLKQNHSLSKMRTAGRLFQNSPETFDRLLTAHAQRMRHARSLLA